MLAWKNTPLFSCLNSTYTDRIIGSLLWLADAEQVFILTFQLEQDVSPDSRYYRFCFQRVYLNSLSLSKSFSTDFFTSENKIILEVRKVNGNSFCNKLVFSEIKVRHFKIQLAPASPGIGFYWETFVTIWLLGRGLTIVKLPSLESFLQAVEVEYSFQSGRHISASAACCYFLTAGFITVKSVTFGLILKLKSSQILVHVTQNSEVFILIFICR